MADTLNRPQTPEAPNPRLIKALQANWQEEMEGAATYRGLAEHEDDAERKQALLEMADSEIQHAERWAGRLHALGQPTPAYHGAATGQADTLANRIGGQDSALRRVELEERRHVAEYGRQIKELGDAESIQILEELIADEREHSKTLRRLVRPSPAEPQRRPFVPTPLDPAKALEEMRAKRGRKSPAAWIGDAIYGVNDGLGAIFGIVSGVSGATLNRPGGAHLVLLAGLAGMIASALSMGSGAYLAAKSEREIYEAELHRKREEIRDNPDEARQELSLIYQVKGIPAEDAHRMAEHLSRNEEQFLRTLAAEELNLTEDALSNPMTSAVSGALSTALGALIPIIPFFFMTGWAAIIAAAIISLIAHFAVGAAKTLITVRSWWSSGMEMTLVGAVEGVVTYVIGLGLSRLGAAGAG
ncbi:MAG: VIT1/CCC1 transporter family protein [Armatimonadetes bacterium]|nr:VIT1/CCC1 transporter family protein [Armatimonadota bacterium]